MRAVGVALDEATLQETAYALGINRRISEMTRAQKTQLLYYQMITKTATMQGDMARTLLQPANALRVLKDQFTQLARAIGNIFIPILMSIVPYVQVIVKWLTTLAQAIANFLGFKLEIPDYKDIGIGNVSAGIQDIEDSAGKAGKEIKKMLAPFDELNVIDFGKDSAGGSGSGAAGGGLLDIPLPEYDALSGALNKNFEEVEKRLKSILPYVVAIGAAFLAWKIGSGIVGLLKSLGLLTPLLKTLGITVGTLKLNILGIALVIGGAVLYFTGFFDILNKGKPFLEGFSKALIGLGVIVGGIALVFGSTTAIVVAIVGAIGIAIATVIRYWDEIMAFLKPIGEWIWKNVIQPIISFFEELWKNVVNIFKKIWNSITSIILPIVNWTWSNIISPTINIVMTLFKKISEIVLKIWEIITTVLGVVANWVWNTIIKPVINYVVGLARDIGNTVQGIWTTISNVLGGVWNSITGTFSGIVYWIENNVVRPIQEAFTRAWNFVAAALGGIIKGVVNGVLSTVERFINRFIRGLNNVVWLINQIPGVEIGYVSYLSLPRFEDGGFPEKGQMFIANEAGPELVGNIGNRAVVANNNQIIEGIKQGVKEAMVESQRSDEKRTTIVNIGNRKVYEGYGSYANSQSNRYGKNVIRV